MQLAAIVKALDEYFSKNEDAPALSHAVISSCQRMAARCSDKSRGRKFALTFRRRSKRTSGTGRARKESGRPLIRVIRPAPCNAAPCAAGNTFSVVN
jgi:hypothetical protein